MTDEASEPGARQRLVNASASSSSPEKTRTCAASQAWPNLATPSLTPGSRFLGCTEVGTHESSLMCAEGVARTRASEAKAPPAARRASRATAARLTSVVGGTQYLPN